MNWVYPWDTTGFQGSWKMKDWIVDELRSKYPIMRKKPVPGLADKERSVLDSVLGDLVKLDEAGKPPWILVASNSKLLLQTIATYVPITMALSKQLKPCNVDTDRLIDLFKQPAPRDDFEPDPAGEAISQVMRFGMLVWERFNMKSLGAANFESRFGKLLSERAKPGLFTMFLCDYSTSFNQKTIEALKNRIGANYGESITGFIDEFAFHTNFYVPVQSTGFKTVEV